MPFTIEEFFKVFKDYNISVFPIQIFLNILALAIIILAIIKKMHSDKLISISLGFLWIWVGVVYHLIFFSRINPAANIFALIFVLQGIIFIYLGAIKERLSFGFRKDWIGIVGLILIIYSLIIYPILGYFFGHIYPNSPTFGLPCPTTIFTFGILIWSVKKVPIIIFIIPLLWSIIGSTAAINFNVYEDFGLIILGLLGLVCIMISNRNFKFAAINLEMK